MKIDTIEINEFRGIPELEISANSENLCLLGPNGTGKSSVIEAVDFVLTGDIRDLSGDASGELSIIDHGPHQHADPDDAWVKATFVDESETFTIKRSIGERNNPEFEGSLPDKIERMMESAEKGQHYLSRREILNFIVTQNRSRADKLRELLDIRTLRDKRLELEGAAEQLDTEASRREREREQTLERLLDLFDEEGIDGVFAKVNDVRQDFGGEPLDEFEPDVEFRSGLESPTERAQASALQSTQTQDLLETIEAWFDEEIEQFWSDYDELCELVEEIRDDDDILEDLDAIDLIRRGKSRITEETDRCPLCLKDWDGANLIELLEEREENAERASELRDEIDEIRDSLLDQLTNVRTAIESLVGILDQHDDYKIDELQDYAQVLNEIEEGMESDITEEIPMETDKAETREEMLAPGPTEELVVGYSERASELPDLEEVEADWEALGSAFDYFTSYCELKEDAAALRTTVDEMELVAETFVEARDEVMQEIYDEIAERFEEFYTTLHDDEEEEFAPKFVPTTSGLSMQVGFHGVGKHPPHSLHSEGHQDSMGLCLFLALCDRLESDDLSVVMLDDVVMSIDAQHRRQLASLLAEEISENFQLIISTHDELWYRHLKTEGVVRSSNAVTFRSWSLENGPVRVDQLSDGWSRIEEFLDEGDVPGAAHRLRHTSEWFMREACHQLNAEVQFKSDGRWMLGDFVNPCLSRFKEILKQAKRAGQSWGNDIGPINELDNQRSDISGKIHDELGMVSPNVHFNENHWATFSTEEMREVVEVFKELHDTLWCDECGSCLQVMENDHKEVMVRCRCTQKANWTLEEA